MKSRLVPALLIMNVSVLCYGACSAARSSSVGLKGRLALSLKVERNDVAIGDSAGVTYVLKNSSDGVVVACIAEGGGFNLLGPTRGTGLATPVDHPGCVRRFELRPGTSLEWPGTIEIPDVGMGSAKLNAWVQVVDPSHCDKKYGCDSANITSPFVVLNVRARDPRSAGDAKS